MLTSIEVIDRHNAMRAENELLRAELIDALNNLALAEAETRNLRAWQGVVEDVLEHMMTT